MQPALQNYNKARVIDDFILTSHYYSSDYNMKALNIDEVEGEKLGNTEAIRKILVYSENLMLQYARAQSAGHSGCQLAYNYPHYRRGHVDGVRTILHDYSSFLVLERNRNNRRYSGH